MIIGRSATKVGSVEVSTMSEESLSAFFEAVKADAALQEKLKGVTDPQTIVSIAKEAGFSFSSEKLLKTELSDEEMASLAGGANSPYTLFPALIQYLGAVGTGWSSWIRGLLRSSSVLQTLTPLWR